MGHVSPLPLCFGFRSGPPEKSTEFTPMQLNSPVELLFLLNILNILVTVEFTHDGPSSQTRLYGLAGSPRE